MRLLKSTVFWELVVFGLVLALFLVKLDRHYFFTDEILYVQRGVEQFQGIFTDTLQVPPLPKYLAGVGYMLFGNNLSMLRLPFALIGVLASYLLYLIIKREFNPALGLVGVTLYATSRIIFDASRMVMLEPVMHLFWLLFLYFYYDTFSQAGRRKYLISGVFLGLSLSTKLTSVVLIPFVVLGFAFIWFKKKNERRANLRNYLWLGASATLPVVISYLHFFYKSGFVTAIVETAKGIKDVYLTKSEEGKTHVVGGSVYAKSPWWTYIYYHVQYNGIARTIFYVLSSALLFLKSRFFVLYWSVFFTLVLLFCQFSGVKNVRYISSIEIPLIILAVAGLNYVMQRFGKIAAFGVIPAVLALFIINQLSYLRNLQYTEYAALFTYFRNETLNFTEYKRMYVLGSVRSMKYYRDMVSNSNMMLWRKDYAVMCPEFGSFDYFAFDREELLKDPANFLYQYVTANIENFDRVPHVQDMFVFKKNKPFQSVIACPSIVSLHTTTYTTF